MAKAPIPGAGKRKQEAEEAKKVVRLRIRDEERSLAVSNVTLKDRLLVRKATGLPFEAFFGEVEFGLDSLQVIWWLAGRAEGDAFLTLKKVEEEWPDDLDEGDIDLVEITPDEKDASDPQS